MLNTERLNELLAAYDPEDLDVETSGWLALANTLVNAAPELLAVVEAAREFTNYSYGQLPQRKFYAMREALRALDGEGASE